MMYTIIFSQDADGPREPVVFDAANDGVGLEWLHLLGCGHNAQLWRGDTLLCTLHADLSQGFFEPDRGDDRPVGSGWYSLPEWVAAGDPDEDDPLGAPTQLPEPAHLAEPVPQTLPVPLPPLRLPTLAGEDADGDGDQGEPEQRSGLFRRRLTRFSPRENPDKAEEETATGVFEFMLRDR